MEVRIEIGPNVQVYVSGSYQVVIVPDSDGELREDRTRVYVTDGDGLYKEWRVRDVLPETGYVQCNVLDPDDHDSGATMFVRDDSIVAFLGREYERISVASDHIMAIPFEN